MDAFEVIYKAAFSFVSNVAFRVVGNKEDAEEVAQEVFVTLFKNLKNFRFESSLKTWVYRVSVNSAINFSRKSARHRGVSMEDMQLADTQHTLPGVHEKMDEEYNERLIAALLNKLNTDQRACIVLRSFEGLSYEDIAKALSIPVNTVRSRLKRAREAMLAYKQEAVENEL